jgi:threonine/homoserine/homoserine lactone efflux protein
MPLNVWFCFMAAATVLLLIPGPTVPQCIGGCTANEQRRNWATVLGVGVGDAVAMGFSLLGAGALLSASSLAFTTMKTIGGVYLLYLGAKAIASAKKAAMQVEQNEGDLPWGRPSESALLRFSKASTVTLLNPKSILFFVAFVPQFINAGQSLLRRRLSSLLPL